MGPAYLEAVNYSIPGRTAEDAARGRGTPRRREAGQGEEVSLSDGRRASVAGFLKVAGVSRSRTRAPLLNGAQSDHPGTRNTEALI